jgi:CBS-domain-containing membrane protein
MIAATPKSSNALTAADLMNHVPAVVPGQMLMRQAVRLIQQVGATEAPVVDEQGHYVGMLCPADAFRWVVAGCPETVVGPISTCPYQVRGRLLNGEEAVICILADGRCPFQAVQPTTGGRHTAICMRKQTEALPFGTLSSYVTTDVITVGPAVPLIELERKIIDARADRVVVLDDFDTPIGIVSAIDVLNAITNGKVSG